MPSNLIPSVAPITRRVRAYFAPVNRTTATATIFDAANIAGFNPDAPPAPWIDLGWCRNFARKSATKAEALMTGAPAVASGQVRTAIEALVALEFESWGKLQLALTAGVQQMNVLAAQPGATANGSGGTAVAAVPLTAGSSATTASALDVGATAAAVFAIGEAVAVDLDYTGQTGFVGSGVSAGYVRNLALIGADIDYIRRVTLNVARVTAINAGVLTLGSPLIAGVPVVGMSVSRVVGFCDREGGSFFQEWSALFLLDGAEGDRVLFHYPRLQSTLGPAETHDGLAGVQAASLQRLRLAGSFRALPVKDANDGESVVCFRSYLPGPMRTI
jgi:hypothetical protein